MAPGEKVRAGITALPAQDNRGHTSEWTEWKNSDNIDRETLAARVLHKDETCRSISYTKELNCTGTRELPGGLTKTARDQRTVFEKY
jgi:hypothetical protein